MMNKILLPNSIRTLFLLALVLMLFNPAMADRVNINKADAATLQANLQGIGPVKAKTIVDYRKKHGSFKSLNDLANVPGIGKSILSKNKNNLSTTRGLEKIKQGKLKKSDMKSSKKTSKKSLDKSNKKTKEFMKNKPDKTAKKLKKDKKSKKDKLAKMAKKDKNKIKNKADKYSKKKQ